MTRPGSLAPLQQRLLAAFLGEFDAAPALVAQAAGRVNLIGEHTDYNDGFVLPCAIDMGTRVAIRPRSDAVVRVVAADFGNAIDEFRLDTPIAARHGPRAAWANYVRGVLIQLRENGLPPRGANVAIAGDLPRGAGLSSSASLEVALAQAFKLMAGLEALTPQHIARLAQRAENEFVGCQCGIMDPLVAACGQAGHALLIDCRSLATQAVPLPRELAVMVVHSRIRRGLVESEYNLRREQCEQAARHLGVAALRDATLAQLEGARDGLAAVAWRRAHHVITENTRTLGAAEALAAGDLRTLGRLMAESHESMRTAFEITTPAIDHLAQVLREAIGDEGGARMTGGGFGGCVVALMPTAKAAAAEAAVAQHYRSPSGERAAVYLCQAAGGASEVA